MYERTGLSGGALRKRRFRPSVAAALCFALTVTAGAVFADGPSALYRGGVRDGYTVREWVNTTQPRVLWPRAAGGSRDGYAVALAENVKVLGPQGTMIFLR